MQLFLDFPFLLGLFELPKFLVGSKQSLLRTGNKLFAAGPRRALSLSGKIRHNNKRYAENFLKTYMGGWLVGFFSKTKFFLKEKYLYNGPFCGTNF